MKTLHTIYTSFAKRLALTLTLILTFSVGQIWSADYNDVGTSLTNGKSYILVAGGSYAITASTPSSGWIGKTDVSNLITNQTLKTDLTNIVWIATDEGDGKWSFKNDNNYITNNSGNEYRNMACSLTKSIFTIKNDKIYSTGNTGKWLQGVSSGFRMYSTSQSGAKETFVFYELTESCANSVAVSAGTNTNVSSMSFSSTAIATCSSTPTERQVTITVTPSTGYEMTSGLTFTKTSGTATATCVSDPTTDGSSYQFVYRFNQNDNGVGTFSASCTAKKTTVSFDQNGGEEGQTASVTATYDQPMPTPITLPTRYGHTFGGYYDGEGGTGTQYYTAEGASARTWDKTSASAILYAKWTEKPLTNYRTTCSTKADPNLSWSASTCVATMEVDNEFPTLTNPYDLLVRFSSSDPTVATIDENNGTITLLKSGTTTITASYDEDENYLSASASYTLTVYPSNCRWVEIPIEDITPEDEIVVTMGNDKTVYALGTETIDPSPKSQAITITSGMIDINQDFDYSKYTWSISAVTGGYTLQPYGTTDTYLYGLKSLISIGDNSTNNVFTIFTSPENGNKCFMYTIEYIPYYLGHGTEDGQAAWKRFESSNTLKSNTLKFYKKTCLPANKFWIDYELANVTCTNTPPHSQIDQTGEDLLLEFSANDGYKLPESISVSIGNNILPEDNDVYIWDSETGELFISAAQVTDNITITIEGCELLAIPTNLKADNITSSSATLSWDEIDHATEYQVHITDDDDSTEDIITTTSNTYYEVTGLSSASAYLWGVTPIASGYCGITQEAEYFETLDVYTVTFNTDGGTPIDPQNVDHGTKATKPANPTKTGYTFAGWYTEADTEFNFNTPITSATTLYAKWNANQYTITFLKQRGDGGTDNATVTFNSNNFSVVTIELPTRDGYEFGGYYTETGGAGLQIVDAEGKWLKNKTGYLDASGNWIKAASVNLYAKWTKIHTITWVVNNNTETPHYTSMVLDGNTIDELPNAPADDLFEDCDVNAFVGWSTDNIGFNPDPTAPTDLFKTVAEAQNKIGAISADKKFYAVYASASNGADSYKLATTLEDLFDGQTVIIAKDNGALEKDNNTIDKVNISPDGNGNLSNVTDNIKWTLEASDTHWKLKNNGGYLGVTSTANQTAVSVTETNNVWQIAKSTASGDYFYICQPNTTIGLQYYNSRWQIYSNNSVSSSTNFTLKIYVPNVSNYITRCTALPDPVWGGATIDKTEIAVNCGETSSTTGAAKISFLKETNYNLYKDITVEVTSGNFIIASSRNGEYSTSVTLTPTQSGTNVGTLDGKYVYVRAVAPAMSDEDFTGTITISGKQLAQDQVIEVTAEVSCTQYTLTFYDQGQTKTVEGFAGTSVVAPEPWAETCSEPFQYVFDGWATAPVTNGTEGYEKVDFSTFTMPNNNTTTLYAVYRYAEEGGEPVNGYVKVTEALADWSGDYVIVDDENLFAIKNAYRENTDANKTLAGETVTIENDKVVSPSANIVWSFSKNGDGYTMYNAAADIYAGIGTHSRAAVLSEIIADENNIKIIFDDATNIAKVSGIKNDRCFQYHVDEGQKEWRTYSSNQSQYNTGYLYRLSNKTIRYTSSLVCGTIEAEDAIVTSTVDQTVKVYVPITLEYSDVASITGTSDNEAFTVVTKNDVAVGESTIEVHYKPTAYVNTANQEETATITLTTSKGATTTFNITGRCLPETFAIVAKVGNIWYALPSQGLNSGTTPVGYPVEVDNNDNPTAVTAVPEDADWPLRQVLNNRFTANGENLVFVNAENKTLYANDGNANIQTYAEYSNYAKNNPDRYEWVPTTTDLTNYTLKNVERAKELSINVNASFGTHTSNIASNNLRFLPIQNRYTPAALQVVEWKENSVVIMYNGDPAQTAYVSVNGGEAQTTTLSAPQSQRDIAVYELTANGLADNPTQRLSITIDAEKVILSIPYIISGTQTDYELLPGSSVSAKREAAKIADLIVLNAATLTAAGSKSDPYRFRNVTIYGGGSLIIPAEKGFGANTLTMRVGGVENGQYKNLYPQLQLKGTLTNTSGQINLDYLTTNDFYYPLSVPYSVTISDIQYPVDIYGTNVIPTNTGSFQFKYYDGAERAAGRTGWIVLDEKANPTLNPNTGYAIWGIPKKVKVNGGESTRQKFGIHRLPLKQTAANMMISEQQSHSATINVYNGSKRDSDNGWNYLGNPYLSHYGDFTTADNVMKLGKLVWDEEQGAWVVTDEEQRYVVFTNDCQNYTAELASTTAIPAFSAFFIQADQGGAINFTSPNVATPQSLAARHSEEETKEITTGIILSGEKHSDRTGLLIADLFTEAYEFNADLSKFDNQDMNLYTISPNGKLAFMAINEELAKQTIPLGYSVSADGMYSIAFDEQRYSRNDIYALYLIDYDRNETTNLLHMDYNFYSETGAHAERFALQVAFAPKTATDVEYTQVGDVLVSREGNTLRLDNLPSDVTVTVYDAVGHLVEQHTASQLLQLTLQKGYYLLHIGNNQNSVVIDTFIP